MTTMADEWLELTDRSDQIAPSTRVAVKRALGRFERYLKDSLGSRYRKDKVRIADFRAYKLHLLRKGKNTSYVSTEMNFVTTYYSMLADEDPGKWEGFLAKLRVQKRPKNRGSRGEAYPPYPLEVMPDILEAAEESTGRGLMSEAYPVTALFFYTGIRAQGLGLRVKDLDFEDRLIHTRVKFGYPVKIVMHKRLAEILREHLASRNYESEMLFVTGKYPYNYIDNSSDEDAWELDERNEGSNRTNVQRVLRRVRTTLRERGIDERLMSHRFRVSVRTYASQFKNLTVPPMDDKDGRILLTHGAKDITDFYDHRDPRVTRDKWDQIDLGSREWVERAVNGERSPQPTQGQTLDANAIVEMLKSMPKEQKAQIIAALLEA